jgi:hypothetical protein
MAYFTNYAFVDPSLPDTWGAKFWDTLQVIAAGYPENPTEEKREQFKIFFDSLVFVLPCEECKQHYSEVLERKPLNDAALINRKTLNRWIMDIHNIVNADLGKNKQYTWREYCRRFKGVDDKAVYPQRNAERINRKARILSRNNVIPKPDNSLGTVGNTPAKWGSATKGWNDTAMKSLQSPQPNSVYVPAPSYGGTPKKKCGCAKS